MCLIWMLTLYSKFLTLYLCLEQWKLLLWRRVFFLPNFFILILLFFFVFRCISQLVFFFFCWIFLTSCYLFRGILIACHLAEEQVNERKWIPPYTFLFFLPEKSINEISSFLSNLLAKCKQCVFPRFFVKWNHCQNIPRDRK